MAASPYKLDCRKPSTLALLFLYGFPACVAVSLSPSLTAIRHTYELSGLAVRSVMTMAMLAYALGPLFSAPLSLFMGRKGAILSGIGISLAGYGLGTWAAFFGSFDLFLLGRVVSIFGAAVSFCLAYAVISDFYHEKQARAILAAIAAAFCVIPGIIMAICGQITEHLGWQWTMVFMAAYSVITLVLCLGLPETHPAEGKGMAEVRQVFKEYAMVLGNRTFIYCALITGLAVAALYVYATDAALIATEQLGMSAGEFGYLSIIPYLGAIISLSLVQKLGDKLNFISTTLMGYALILIAGGLMLLFFMRGVVNAWTIFGLTFVLIGGTMPLNVTYVTIAENSTPYRGVVASLISAVFMFTSLFAVQASAWLNPLLGVLEYPATLCGLLALLVLVFVVMFMDSKRGRPALKGEEN